MPRKTTSSHSTSHKTKNSPTSPSKQATSVTPSDLPKQVREYWERLEWGSISEHFGTRTLQRGRDYAEHGHVQSLWITKDGKNLLAIVSGTDDYQTLVTLKKSHRKNEFEPSSTCSCPVGYHCKHGVAAIVHFLDCLAKKQSLPLCRELAEYAWEVVAKNGKTKTMKIDFDDDDYDDDGDDENWNDDGESPKSSQTTRPVSLSTTSPKKVDLRTSLESKLNSKSQKELVAMILRFAEDYDAVREQFEQEAFAESVAQSGSITKLVEKAIKLIDKEIGSVSHSHYDCYGGYARLSLGPVEEIVKQFRKFDDALAAVDRVARHLIKKGIRYAEESGAEDTCEIDGVFEEIAKTLTASTTPPVSIILWALEISDIDEYDFTGYAFKETIHGRGWSPKIWSDVADALLAALHENIADRRGHGSLRTIVETLDKAQRQSEATDLLRTEAVHTREQEMLVDRLLKFGFIDEAKKICSEQRQSELKNERHTSFYHDSWSGRLKKIAEMKKDYPTQASIEAAEFFDNPRHETILLLLQTAKKMKIEPAIRRSLEAFLKTGVLPIAVRKGLEGVKPSAKDLQDWQIPFFEFQIDQKELAPRFDILCEWAIAENRPNDVVRWFDELSKQKTVIRLVSREKVADAIFDSHPDRAFQFYRDLAEHEMETTRNYLSAVRVLRKARKVLEASGRVGDWKNVIAEIRATHRRKSSLMNQLNELEAGSIVNQKRKG